MRKTALLTIAMFVAVGCGSDDNNTATPNNTPNNTANNTSNNTTAPNNTTATNNTTGTTGPNNTTGTTGPNNTTGTTGTNNTTNTTGTNNTTNPGAITVRSSIAPNQGVVGTMVTFQFTELTNFTLDPDNIGGPHVDGFGHYHIYVDMVDADHQLLESGLSPDMFAMEIATEVLAAGAHNLIVKVHKNDHSEYQNPIEFTIPFTITE